MTSGYMKKYCYNCGKSVGQGTKFCGYCGREISITEKYNVEPGRKYIESEKIHQFKVSEKRTLIEAGLVYALFLFGTRFVVGPRFIYYLFSTAMVVYCLLRAANPKPTFLLKILVVVIVLNTTSDLIFVHISSSLLGYTNVPWKLLPIDFVKETGIVGLGLASAVLVAPSLRALFMKAIHPNSSFAPIPTNLLIIILFCSIISIISAFSGPYEFGLIPSASRTDSPSPADINRSNSSSSAGNAPNSSQIDYSQLPPLPPGLSYDDCYQFPNPTDQKDCITKLANGAISYWQAVKKYSH